MAYVTRALVIKSVMMGGPKFSDDVIYGQALDKTF